MMKSSTASISFQQATTINNAKGSANFSTRTVTPGTRPETTTTITTTSENNEDSGFYSEFLASISEINPKDSLELFKCLAKRNMKRASQIIQDSQDLLVELPRPSTILNCAFDMDEPLRDPNYELQDRITRDDILKNYLLSAVQFTYSIGFSPMQIAIWLTIFKRTHLKYVETVQATNKPNSKKCLDIFKTNLYSLTSITNQNGSSLFTRHDIKQLVDYFSQSYIQHLRLITWVFTQKQSRIKILKKTFLDYGPTFTPLRKGILEEKWEDYLKEQEDIQEAKRQAQIEAELKALEPQPETNEKTPDVLPPSESTLLLAPFPTISSTENDYYNSTLSLLLQNTSDNSLLISNDLVKEHEITTQCDQQNATSDDKTSGIDGLLLLPKSAESGDTSSTTTSTYEQLTNFSAKSSRTIKSSSSINMQQQNIRPPPPPITRKTLDKNGILAIMDSIDKHFIGLTRSIETKIELQSVEMQSRVDRLQKLFEDRNVLKKKDSAGKKASSARNAKSGGKK